MWRALSENFSRIVTSAAKAALFAAWDAAVNGRSPQAGPECKHLLLVGNVGHVACPFRKLLADRDLSG